MVKDKYRLGIDPLGEENVTISQGLIYRYKNRILLQLTMKCASECPFCYRQWSRNEQNEFEMTSKNVDEAMVFIKEHQEINEVVLSGGDPLVNVDCLKYALSVMDESDQIKVIRIHTRAPIVKPEMVTEEVLEIFKKIKNSVLYVSLHTNHPNELTKSVVEAVKRIRETGAILFTQSVFLKGINDSAEVLCELFTKLLQIGVRPYNIYHCSTVKGAEHFIVPLDEEARIMTDVKKKVSGLAFPTLIIDTPGTAGKIPVPLDFWQVDRSFYWDYEGNKFNGS